MKQKILIVDDERDMCWTLSQLLGKQGYITASSPNSEDAFRKINEFSPDLVLLDLRLPRVNGLKVLAKIRKWDTELPVIMLTAYGDIRSAVKAIKLGAFDYVSKPLNSEEIKLLIKKALQARDLNREVTILRQHLTEKLVGEKVIGESTVMKRVFSQIKQVAPTDLTVIIQGESGSGKEVIARLIHQSSLRKNKPFVAIDCGTLPEGLVESELFGHEKGAFTSGDKRKLGQFELAHDGTIFLDEVTNLSISVQAKLLRVLQERQIQHLGGQKPINVDVRILVASNKNLSDAVNQGKFREDLYHRLNEFNINIPPLKERGKDIVLLSYYFLKEANDELHKKIKDFSPKVLRIYQRYPWPGNVRELKNVVRRAVLLARDEVLPDHLPEEFLVHAKRSLPQREKSSLKLLSRKISSETEKQLIKETLTKTNNNKTKTARILSIDRSTLYVKMRDYGLL